MVTEMGEIVPAPPKLTIPPEMVPIVMPSLLTAATQSPPPLLPLLYVQGRELV